MFDAAVAAALPETCVPAHLPAPPKGRTIVVGAGKASAAIALALETHWPGPLAGLVVTRYGHRVLCEHIDIVEAAHPVPDERGREAAAHIVAMVRDLSADDLVIALISGGGSALLSLPAPGLTLDDKQWVNRALLRSGAHIGEMNCVRKPSLGDQRRAACRDRLSCADRSADYLGRAGGRSVRDRLGPEGGALQRPHEDAEDRDQADRDRREVGRAADDLGARLFGLHGCAPWDFRRGPGVRLAQ